MYQNNELKHLYERLKAQYPQCGLEFSRNHLTLTRPYTRIEIDRDGVELYVNEQLYDRFSSEEVDDPDDLYELLEAFLLDLQHAGMEQGNQLYRDTRDQAARKGSPAADPDGAGSHCGASGISVVAEPVADAADPGDSDSFAAASEAGADCCVPGTLGLPLLRYTAASGAEVLLGGDGLCVRGSPLRQD